jgi:hypothetical protein
MRTRAWFGFVVAVALGACGDSSNAGTLDSGLEMCEDGRDAEACQGSQLPDADVSIDEREPDAPAGNEGLGDEHPGGFHDGREDSRTLPCTTLQRSRGKGATLWRDRTPVVIM